MLNARAFGVAMGTAYAAYMALLAWKSGALGVGREMVDFTARFYPGYRPTFTGGLVGAAYGFLLGFPMGWLVARIYNSLMSASRVEQPTHPVP